MMTVMRIVVHAAIKIVVHIEMRLLVHSAMRLVIHRHIVKISLYLTWARFGIP